MSGGGKTEAIIAQYLVYMRFLKNVDIQNGVVSLKNETTPFCIVRKTDSFLVQI